MPAGGRLVIRTLTGKDHFSLIVEDTGIGMSEQVLRKIFVPFFTTKDIGQGTGLGLPVVHGIVTSHGGSIKVESKVNQGTRFEIQLPVTESQNIVLGNENVTSG
jgi:signal transduction histidine kinase